MIAYYYVCVSQKNCKFKHFKKYRGRAVCLKCLNDCEYKITVEDGE